MLNKVNLANGQSFIWKSFWVFFFQVFLHFVFSITLSSIIWQRSIVWKTFQTKLKVIIQYIFIKKNKGIKMAFSGLFHSHMSFYLQKFVFLHIKSWKYRNLLLSFKARLPRRVKNFIFIFYVQWCLLSWKKVAMVNINVGWDKIGSSLFFIYFARCPVHIN